MDKDELRAHRIAILTTRISESRTRLSMLIQHEPMFENDLSGARSNLNEAARAYRKAKKDLKQVRENIEFYKNYVPINEAKLEKLQASPVDPII